MTEFEQAVGDILVEFIASEESDSSWWWEARVRERLAPRVAAAIDEAIAATERAEEFDAHSEALAALRGTLQ